MRIIRRQIFAIGLAVAGVQAFGLALTTVRLCCSGGQEAPVPATVACPMQHGPGEECPMPHDSNNANTHRDDGECRLTCGASDDAVGSNQGPTGFLPVRMTLASPHQFIAFAPAGEPSVTDIWSSPLSPPPRS